MSLAVKAHCQGSLDFGRSGRYNYQYRLKEAIILRQILDDLILQIKRTDFDRNTAASGSGMYEVYSTHHDRAAKISTEMFELLIPWKTSGFRDDLVRRWELAHNMKVGSPEFKKLSEQYERIAKLKGQT